MGFTVKTKHHVFLIFNLIPSFTKAISEGINVVQEGATLRLEVKRERGTFRDVHVSWKITPNAVITNSSSQISPMNGSVTFKQVCVEALPNLRVEVFCFVCFFFLSEILSPRRFTEGQARMQC